jgi:hypothetical protein
MTPSDPGTEYAIIDTRERFDNALSSLVTESCRAWDHWTLLLHLDEAYEKYAREFYQTPAFWSTVTRSLQDISILRIATLLDPRKDVVSVPNILRIINIHARGNGSKLGIELENFDEVKIEDDIKSVHRLDPVVDKILTMRNDFLAHRSINIVATRRINLLPELKNQEVSAMLDLVYQLATKYAVRYGQNPTMRSMVGADDYKTMLEALRSGFDFGDDS